MITLVSGGVSCTVTRNYIDAGITDPEHIVRIKRASETNGVTTDDLEELFETLNELGELGTKITEAHPAAKTTIDALKQTPELATELNTLNNENLKVVITLVEEHEHISAEEMRATVKAVTL